MERILRKIDFSNIEIIKYENEIKRLTNILKLNEYSLSRANESLEKNFDLTFKSITMLLKQLFLVIFEDFRILENDHKELIQMAVPMPTAIPAVINELNSDKHITCSEYLIIYLSGIVFDVYTNICSSGINSCKRCGLNLSRETLYINPEYILPKGIMSCFAYCDELHKTGELLNIEHNITHYNLMDIKGVDFEDKKECLCLGLKALIKENTDKSDDLIEESLKKNNNRNLELNLLLNKINHILAKQESIYVSFNEISLLNIINLVYFDDHYYKSKSILETFIQELKIRIREKQYIIEKPIRLGCMHLPFTNPRVDRVFLNNGAGVIASSMYYMEGPNVKCSNEYERTIGGFLNNKTLLSVKEKAAFIDSIINKYKLHGFLFGQFENDRTLGSDQLMIMKEIKNKDKAFYMSMQNWHEINENYITKIESLVYVIKKR